MAIDPKKVFNFVVEFEGLDSMHVQEAKIPDTEMESVEHGAGDYKVKTPGMKIVGDIELKKLRVNGVADSWAWDWMESARSKTSNDFKKTLVLRELNIDESGTTDGWMFKGAWVKKISVDSYKRLNSDNII